MRMLAVAVVASLVTFTAAQAAAPTPNNNSRSFGSATCRQPVSCHGTGDTSTLISIANTCVNQHFGYPVGDGFFDEYSGLDRNNCLAAKPNVLPKGVGLQLSPQCCIIQPNPDVDVCNIHCDLTSVQPGH